MVGVPGRSKGCHTCRRRKIKCDLAKPNCERCQKSGRECEGYARGAVFLNRTPQGMLKREHLDEVAPRETPSFSSSSPEAPSPNNSQLSVVWGSRSSSGSSDRSISPPGSVCDVYAVVSDRKVLTAGLESYYVNRFVPLESRNGDDTCGIWSVKALAITNRGEALDNAFAALAFNRAGRDQNDLSLVMQGREAYGRALRACSKSLLDPRAVRSDQLLAACNLLKSYEIQEATSNSTTGHDSHIAGLTKLISHRGKEALRSEHNKYLIGEVRYSAMIIALQYRKRNPLGDRKWSAKSWKSPRDMQQSLYDTGFLLAAIAEDIDHAAKKPREQIKAEEVGSFTTRILTAHDHLKCWHQRLLQDARLRLDWSNADALPSDLPYESPYDTGGEDKPRIPVSLLSQRLMMMDYWSLRIAMCMVLKTFEQDMRIHNPDRVGPDLPLNDIMLNMTDNIALTAPLCLSTDYGIYGQARTIYALRVGLVPARLIKTPRAQALKQRFEALIAFISSTSVRNVGAVSKISDSWRGAVEEQDHEFES